MKVLVIKLAMPSMTHHPASVWPHSSVYRCGRTSSVTASETNSMDCGIVWLDSSCSSNVRAQVMLNIFAVRLNGDKLGEHHEHVAHEDIRSRGFAAK